MQTSPSGKTGAVRSHSLHKAMAVQCPLCGGNFEVALSISSGPNTSTIHNTGSLLLQSYLILNSCPSPSVLPGSGCRGCTGHCHDCIGSAWAVWGSHGFATPVSDRFAADHQKLSDLKKEKTSQLLSNFIYFPVIPLVFDLILFQLQQWHEWPVGASKNPCVLAGK